MYKLNTLKTYKLKLEIQINKNGRFKRIRRTTR